mgnify:CR=1 FL=1
MQEVKTQERQYINRAEILLKAVDVAKKLHDVAIWTVRQLVPETDYYEMPAFLVEWIKAEVHRLWGLELLREEVEYLWLKSVAGF